MPRRFSTNIIMQCDVIVNMIILISQERSNAKSYRSYACRTNIKQFTILYRGPKIWNSLPTDIINTDSDLLP